MKKSIIGIVALVIIIVLILVLGKSPSDDSNLPDGSNKNGTSTASTAPVPVSETTKVTGKISQFQNSELGFSVDYPNTWEANATDAGVTFIMPIDQSQVSTVAKLQAEINVFQGKCAFPPVTTIKDRGTLTIAGNAVNMISMSSTVQGRSYVNRMYSLQKGSICYIFHFSSIALSPESKKLTGSNLTQARNNNIAIVNSADAEFTTMVKSFAFVTGPVGVDESKASPVKK
ncbi:MAG: hypothetical protein WC648_01710 [Candidatus Paceibacterota bacterium]|jgi:hypothetical protein